MKRLFSRNLAALFVALVMVLALTTPMAWAASCTVTFSDPTVTQGNNVTISVRVSGSVAAATIRLAYDQSYLQFVSGDLGVQLAYAGIACFGLSTVFQLVTLPTEFNASRRALAALEQGHLLNEDEMVGARKTLWAAAMTYVAALAVSLAQLFRLLLIVGNRRRND